MYGPDRMYQDLRNLGYNVVEAVAPDGTRFASLPGFTVSLGRFADRVIDLAVQTTADFPMSVAAAIHVRADPQLLDYGDTVPNVRNITQSVLGSDWRYWSNNFQWQGERTARRLMSQVNGIFERA